MNSGRRAGQLQGRPTASRLNLMQQQPHVVLGPLFWGLFRARAQEQREWRYPAGPSQVRVEGIDPVRILVIGDGPAAGCGVLLHELGIAGFLARHIAKHIDRGVVVTVSAQPAASARSTLKGIDDIDLEPFHSIILMLATTDAFCLTSRRSWQRSMAGLVQALTCAGTSSVFVTSAASLHMAVSISPFGRRLTGNHARMLDDETSRICEESNVLMIPLDTVHELTPSTYALWGRRIGTHVIDSLRS